MKIGVVIPTVPGRESILDHVLTAYETSTPHGYELDVCVVEGFPTVGEAWNDGAGQVDGDYLHFGIDDAEPHPGWLEAAATTCHSGMLPAARIVTPLGGLEACGSMGDGAWLPECSSGTPCRATGIPFLPIEVYDAVGVFASIHFYVEDDYYWRATQLGHHLVVTREYCFTHHYKNHDGVRARAQADRSTWLARVAAGDGVLA